MLTAEQVNNPNRTDVEDGFIPSIIKRGMSTKTTVGTMTKFRSHIRRYVPLGGHRDSVEVTILPHPELPGPFSQGGDSGALIIDASFRFVALLTGGSGLANNDLSDMTYGTLFEWIWGLVQTKFPGADLYFEDPVTFFEN